MEKELRNKVSDKYIETNFKRREELLKIGIIVLNHEFNEATMEDIYFSLQSLIGNKNVTDIKIYINSNGGDITALFPLLNIISSQEGKKNIHTYIMGKAYSCGAMLAVSGHKGYRFAHADSEILFHEIATTGEYMKNLQFQIDADRMNELNERLADIIVKKTKMTKKQVEAYMSSNIDKFMTAKEALKLGVIDKII